MRGKAIKKETFVLAQKLFAKCKVSFEDSFYIFKMDLALCKKVQNVREFSAFFQVCSECKKEREL